ncbi:hypothetical protein Tco_1110375 [Tanacetum coccineum]|uniref:Reverse transcriptase Ty1/copia-type domain-containing protein n=1 Tax=Tanacetum coccineum TaxID=301880 RepID=A0ABQ5IIL5_9ASTR
MEPNKAMIKDEEANSVDVNLYRSTIGSLMYLIASRLDIMFAVYACARFQVTLKMSHLYAVKRIFRYLKGQPKLGLWYPRDSPFDLEAFSDSDYAGASLDRKSITGGLNYFLARVDFYCNVRRQTMVLQILLKKAKFNFLIASMDYLISEMRPDTIGVRRQNGKYCHSLLKLRCRQTVVTSIGPNPWQYLMSLFLKELIQYKALVDKKKVIITETSIRSDLHLEDAGGIDCLPTATIFEEMARMGSLKALDEEMARNLEAQIQAELIEEERLARKKEEEANIALIESWDNTQAMMEADFELAQRLQAEEHGEIIIEERSRLFVELMNKRKKHCKSKKAESSEKKAEGSRKKSIDDEAEMKKHMEVVQDDEEIEIDVIPLATKPPIIVEYKIVKEGQKGFYHLIRANGSLNRYSSMIRMLQNISREDLETLWKLVKTKHGNKRLEDDYEKVFWVIKSNVLN